MTVKETKKNGLLVVSVQFEIRSIYILTGGFNILTLTFSDKPSYHIVSIIETML